MKWQVVGIDPAPGKGSTVFNGEEFRHKKPTELNGFLEELKKNSVQTLICWDAPLTPGDLKDNLNSEGIFTQRKIESFFMRKKNRKAPSGISVLGYSGCPHWTISQYLLGFPKLFSGDNAERPFKLIHDFPSDFGNKLLVEVHPALAIWLWLIEFGIIKDTQQSLYYKGSKADKENQKNIIEMLKDKLNCKVEFSNDQNQINDEIDAWVAWKLGELLVTNDGNNPVHIIGNEHLGSFLLPYTSLLKERLNDSEDTFKKLIKE